MVKSSVGDEVVSRSYESRSRWADKGVKFMKNPSKKIPDQDSKEQVYIEWKQTRTELFEPEILLFVFRIKKGRF